MVIYSNTDGVRLQVKLSEGFQQKYNVESILKTLKSRLRTLKLIILIKYNWFFYNSIVEVNLTLEVSVYDLIEVVVEVCVG